MITIGKTIILNENEAPYQGECTASVYNKAHNVISIHSDTGEIKYIKFKNLIIEKEEEQPERKPTHSEQIVAPSFGKCSRCGHHLCICSITGRA